MNEIHDDERMWCRLQPTARYAAAAVFSVFGDPESARLLVPDTSDGVTERQRNLRLRVLSKLLAKFLSDNSADGVLQHKAAQVRTCAPPLAGLHSRSERVQSGSLELCPCRV